MSSAAQSYQYMSEKSLKVIRAWILEAHPEASTLPADLMGELYEDFYAYMTPYPDAYASIMKTLDSFLVLKAAYEPEAHTRQQHGENPVFTPEGQRLYDAFTAFDGGLDIVDPDWLSEVRSDVSAMIDQATDSESDFSYAEAIRVHNAVDSHKLRFRYRALTAGMLWSYSYSPSEKATILLFSLVDPDVGRQWLTKEQMVKVRESYAQFKQFVEHEIEVLGSPQANDLRYDVVVTQGQSNR